MKEESWSSKGVERASFRAVLRRDAKEEETGRAYAACRREMERAKGEGLLLTASLYQYGRFLFLYTEGVGKRIVPEEVLASLSSLLEIWPPIMGGNDEDRRWIHMQPYYYHGRPECAGNWMEGRNPQSRRGRIALLAPGKWEEYMEYHLELVKEGLIEGDRYHFISIHENVLFSYFEEPKTMVNLQNRPGARSGVLDEWLRTDPESHFLRFAPGQGAGPDGNFVFMPCCGEI